MNQPLLERLRQVSNLPSLPAVAMRVLELARRDDVGVADVAKVVSSDPALSAKMLRTVNSSFYALPMQVSTVSHAAALLGLQSVKTLALGFSLASSLNANKSKTFDYDRFWHQSLFSAVAARTLAGSVAVKQREEAFIAGLLSDIGTLVMHRALGREYDELLETSGGDQVELVRLSRQRFELDHAQVGGMLAEYWKFPPILVDSIRQHHNLDDPQISSRDLVQVVHVGVLCGQVFAAKVKGRFALAKQQLRSRFSLDDAAIQKLFLEIHTSSVPLAETFEVRIDSARTLADIEEEAREMLMALTLQAQLQSQEALRLNRQLQEEVNSDALTGLANRARFSAFLESSIAQSRAQKRSLSLLFLDLDRFKSINDTHGHQAGDEVLKRVAKVLLGLVRQTDLAVRYGGEEIAIVLPGMDRHDGIKVAERVRQAIAAERIVVGGAVITVTASIGVAAIDSGGAASEFPTPEALVKAADEGVYGAKAAGRNCVRAHSPKSRAA